MQTAKKQKGRFREKRGRNQGLWGKNNRGKKRKIAICMIFSCLLCKSMVESL